MIWHYIYIFVFHDSNIFQNMTETPWNPANLTHCQPANKGLMEMHLTPQFTTAQEN